jgi:hypothetical protein
MWNTLSEPLANTPENPVDLPASFLDDFLGIHELFSRTLDTVASLNPFRNPTTFPGSRAHDLEKRLSTIENSVPMNRDRVTSCHEKLSTLKQVLASTTLLPAERTAVVATVARFLFAGLLTDRARRSPLDRNLFLDGLRRTLAEDYLLPAPEVRQLLAHVRTLSTPADRAA